MLETKLPQKKLVEKIVSSIDEVKGIDVDLLDLRKINNTVCRFFIIWDFTCDLKFYNFVCFNHSHCLYIQVCKKVIKKKLKNLLG